MTKECKRCGNEFSQKNARDYCPNCRHTVKLEKQRLRSREYTERRGRRLKRERYQVQREAGRKVSANEEATVIDSRHAHGIRVVLPFTRDFSKNKIAVSHNRIFKPEQTRAANEALIWKIKSLHHKFFVAKTWLDVVVYQPSHKGDAVNYLDNFCDAIQKAIGIDDRWFAVRMLNWHIDKDSPRIELKVLQDATNHHAICQLCGVEKPITEFNEATQNRILAQIENHGWAGQKICLKCKAIPLARAKSYTHAKDGKGKVEVAIIINEQK